MPTARPLVLAAALALCHTAADAQTPVTVYECKTGGTATNSLFADEYQFAQDPAGTVMVLDPLIQSMFGAPIDGKIKRENADLVVFGWTVKNVVNGSQQAATLNYTITIKKATLAFDMIMLPLGYSNTFQNVGICTAKLMK